MPRRLATISRSASLIALSALAVHQLRYLLAYGSSAHAELADQGHGYLFEALPVLAGFALAILAAGLLRVALAAAPAPSLSTPRMRALLYAGAIFSVFALQESGEGVLAAHHAAGLDAVFAGGGWIALPLSLLFGALCGLLDGGLARVEALVAARHDAAPIDRSAGRPAAARPRRVAAAGLRPLEFGLARRPPPLGA